MLGILKSIFFEIFFAEAWAKKNLVLFPEIDRVDIFLSPTRPHKSNVYENIYFLFQKKTNKFPPVNLCVQIYVFFLQKIKDRALCFWTKKSAVRVLFKCKLYLKNSIELIKNFFLQLPRWILFLSPAFPETQVWFFRPY